MVDPMAKATMENSYFVWPGFASQLADGIIISVFISVAYSSRWTFLPHQFRRKNGHLGDGLAHFEFLRLLLLDHLRGGNTIQWVNRRNRGFAETAGLKTWRLCRLDQLVSLQHLFRMTCARPQKKGPGMKNASQKSQWQIVFPLLNLQH